MKQTDRPVLNRFRKGGFATATALATTVVFFSYVTTPPAHAQQRVSNGQGQPLSEVVIAFGDKVDKALKHITNLEGKLSAQERARKLQDATMAAQAEAFTRAMQVMKDPASADATGARQKLEAIAAKARAAGQTDLADAINGPNGVVDTNGALQSLKGITKETSKAKVDEAVQGAKEQVEKLVEEANKTLNQFRGVARNAPKELLDTLKGKALAELDKAKGEGEEKLRQAVESYLPPDLKTELAKTKDLKGFVEGLMSQGLYPELTFQILKTQGLLKELDNGKLDFSALGLPQTLDGPLQAILPLFQDADRAHDASMQTAMMAQNLLATAVATGNPYVIAIAAIIALLSFIFGGGGGDGGGGGNDNHDGEGDGTGEGSEKGTGKGLGGPDPESKPQTTTPPDEKKNKMKPGGGGGEVSTDPGSDYFFRSLPNGSEGVFDKTQKQIFEIPSSAYLEIKGDLVAGDGNPDDTVMNIKDWTAVYIQSVNYHGGNTLSVNFGGPNARDKAPKLKPSVGGPEITYTTVTVTFERNGQAVTSRITAAGQPIGGEQ